VPVSVPEVKCPAVREQGVTGTVILEVQVQRDGRVRSVTVAKGMGFGCDKIAAAALRKARFEPARSGDGQPADYELRYEYVFELDE
jgi:protein TonB